MSFPAACYPSTHPFRAVVDPVAGINLLPRLQSHSGDNVPLGFFKDALCTMPATLDGDDVMAWKDVLGTSGLILTFQTAAAKLRIEMGLPVLETTGTQYATISSSITGGSFFIGSRRLVEGSPDFGLVSYVGATLNQYNLIYASGGGYHTANNIFDNHWFDGASGWPVDDGTPWHLFSATSSTPPSGGLTVGKLPGLDLFFLHGRIYSLAYTPTALSDPDRIKCQNYFSSLRSPLNVLAIGDSITAGTPGTVTPATDSYPAQLKALLRTQDLVTNLGAGGMSLEALISGSSGPPTVAQIIAAKRGGTYRDIPIVWAGTNDMANNGHTPAETYAFLVTYLNLLAPHFADIIVIDMLPRDSIGAGSVSAADRATFNGLVAGVQADVSGARIKVYPVSANATIGQDSQNLDGTYYDGAHVHLNITGLAIVAAQLNLLLQGQ